MNEKSDQTIAEYQAIQEGLIEIFRLSGEYAKGALKSAMVMNGGAAIALLAFSGNILSQRIGHNVSAHLATGFSFFSYGVLIAAVAGLMNYVAIYINLQYAQKAVDEGKSLTSTAYIYFKHITIKPWQVIFCLEVITIVIVVLSFVAFYFGVSEIVRAFSVDLTSECNNVG